MMGHRTNQHDAPPAPLASALSDEQFAEIVALLTPVRDLAVAQLAMIAEMKTQRQVTAIDAPAAPEAATIDASATEV